MSNCIWQGTENPRAVRNRHGDDCDDDACRGCLECTQPHCLVCGIEHKLGVCPECLGVARDDLWTIQRLYPRLSGEMTAHYDGSSRGALAHVPGGVAMFLAGPAANPEAHAHMQTHALLGDPKRNSHIGEEWDSDGEPILFTLVWWEDKWRDDRDEEIPDDRATVEEAVEYLDARLDWGADYEAKFADLARDLRTQVTRLEDALREGERPETGAPCMKCGGVQVKEYDDDNADNDKWRCLICKRPSTPEQYKQAVRATYLANATELTATDMLEAYRIKPGTLIVWSHRDLVAKRGRDDSGRRLYDVKQALKQRDKADSGDEDGEVA